MESPLLLLRSGPSVADDIRVLYLIGQFPAINHSYLLSEVQHLRRLGVDVRVVSVSLPDRSSEKLSPQERQEADRTYYLKSVPASRALWLNIAEAFCRPLSYLRGLTFALRLSGFGPRQVLYHLAYFAEAVLVGRYMRQLGISHVHASFSATVALITSRTFPVTMSFGVYGFGELHDPAATHLPERIAGAKFVRSISRYGRGQLMLTCDRTEWPKLIYCPLGIDSAEFFTRPPRAASAQPSLLCVGRLAPEKGQALLLEALAKLKVEGRSAHLTLVGDGPDLAWLQKRARELEINTNVEFEGWIDQARLMKLYSETDLFVLPSLAEGIPMVLMEAMAMQIPCIAPCIAGIPELISNGIEGMMFSVGDVNELTVALRSLLDSPECCLQIGEKARTRVARDYDMARNTEWFAQILREQLSAKSN
jgi:colanic acid/amylovoran biosynthesis glycosyltransferase